MTGFLMATSEMNMPSYRPRPTPACREAPVAGGWQLERQPRWRPDWVRPEHEAQCFDLFEVAFGYRIDPALWRWKYRDTAAPGMGVWRDGRPVAIPPDGSDRVATPLAPSTTPRAPVLRTETDNSQKNIR